LFIQAGPVEKIQSYEIIALHSFEKIKKKFKIRHVQIDDLQGLIIRNFTLGNKRSRGPTNNAESGAKIDTS
jgi:hypothetical protein